jgi:hypothetical protein
VKRLIRLRLLLAWLLILALPLQGHAGTHALMCAAGVDVHPHGAQARACHRHAAPDARVAQAHQHTDGHKYTDTHKHAAKAGSCPACSLAAALATAPPPLVFERPVSGAIPFCRPYLPSVDPALPDRPPRVAAA